MGGSMIMIHGSVGNSMSMVRNSLGDSTTVVRDKFGHRMTIVQDSPDDSVTLFLNQCHAFNQTSVTHTVLNQCLQPNFLMHSLVDSMTMVQVSLGDSMTIVQENVGKWSG